MKVAYCTTDKLEDEWRFAEIRAVLGQLREIGTLDAGDGPLQEGEASVKLEE